MHPEQIKAELRMAGVSPAMLADELDVTSVIVSTVIHGTRSAAGNITDHAAGNLKATATKLHVGTEADNLLKILSNTIKALSDTCNTITTLTVTSAAVGSASGTPLNAAAFTALKGTVDALKTKVDSMTL